MSRSLTDEIRLHREQIRHLIVKSEAMRHAACADDPDFERLVALGGVLHSFYLGVEGMFIRVARDLDGRVPTGEAWHQQLLVQMTRDATKRKPIIDVTLSVRLQAYLSFRHVFRSHYGFELDWGLMRPLVVELPEIAHAVDRAIAVFCSDLHDS